MSQWAEIRHMFLVDGLPKKEIARRLGVDVKTVRRAINHSEAPVKRKSPPRSRLLDPHRSRIESWLKAEPKLTAKRIADLLEPSTGPLCVRTVRKYVARIRKDLFPKEAFVHRTQGPGETMEADFGETWARIGGRLRKVHFLVAVLPYSRAIFAKAYPVERLECLLDGLKEAFAFFGGLPRRVVLDNTSLAVKQVLRGREREETDAFHAFRGSYPFAADFCAPAKGNEKGAVEGGVKYIRNNYFRPMVEAKSYEALNARLRAGLEEERRYRRVGGRTVQAALEEERRTLRPLPLHPPETCRRLSRVADKFGHVRVDYCVYSVPIRYAYQPVWVKLFHDHVEISVQDREVARFERAFQEGTRVLNPLHVLPLLERKHRAVPESTALRQWDMPDCFRRLRVALRGQTRKPDQEWIRVLRLLENHPEAQVVAAVEEALRRGSPRLETVRFLLRRRPEEPAVRPLEGPAHGAPSLEVRPPDLGAYDRLSEVQG